MKKKFIIIFFPLIIIDILTKYYTYHFIPKMGYASSSYPYGGIGIFKSLFGGIQLSIVHVQNLGAAWGIFSAYSEYLLWIRIAIIGALVFYVFFGNNRRKQRVPIILIITGAVGNILDFLFYGHVIDMLYFKFWGFSYPIFNFADCLITTGIFLMFLVSVRKAKRAIS